MLKNAMIKVRPCDARRFMKKLRSFGWFVCGVAFGRSSLFCSHTANDGPANVAIIVAMAIQFSIFIILSLINRHSRRDGMPDA